MSIWNQVCVTSGAGMGEAAGKESRANQLIDCAIESQIGKLKSDGSDQDHPFYIADLGEVARQHERWILNLPDVQPFYAVKCNPDPVLILFLASLGTGFDCASIQEIRTVLGLGTDPSKIIFANPCKPTAALVYARKEGIQKTVFDNLDELERIQCHWPNAQLLLRMYANDDTAVRNFGEKFGATIDTTPVLLNRARELGLDVVGVSFHVGTGAEDIGSFHTALEHANVVFGQGEALGFTMRTLDIGGGFQNSNFENITSGVRNALREGFPDSVEMIAEPGRFYVQPAFTVVCRVIARRRQIVKDELDMLYQNDGIFGNFMNCLLENEVFHPRLIPDGMAQAERATGPHRYMIWGPTCDGGDYVVRDTTLHCEAKPGDWLKYRNMGAYASATATRFNGFPMDYETLYVNSKVEI